MISMQHIRLVLLTLYGLYISMINHTGESAPMQSVDHVSSLYIVWLYNNFVYMGLLVYGYIGCLYVYLLNKRKISINNEDYNFYI